ncbi:MAG: hypothetical protein WCT52_02045 [Candidatus Micrarchaeia archaeon]
MQHTKQQENAGYSVKAGVVMQNNNPAAKIIGSFSIMNFEKANARALKYPGAKLYLVESWFKGKPNVSYRDSKGNDVAVCCTHIYVVNPLPGFENDAAFKSPKAEQITASAKMRRLFGLLR